MSTFLISDDQRRLVQVAQRSRDEARVRMQAAFDLYKMFRSLAEEQSDRFVLKLEAVVELAGANPLEYQWDGRNFVRQSDDDIERRTAAYHAVEHARDEALQKAQHTLFGAISTS